MNAPVHKVQYIYEIET